MRLTLVISSLERGGAQRVLCSLAAAWVEAGREVSLITFDRGHTPAYPLHPGVILHNLDLPAGASNNALQAFWRNARKLRRLRRAICEHHPDVVISFLNFANISTLLATRGLGVPVIISERANPAWDEMKAVWHLLRKWTYPHASALVCQTGTILAWLQSRVKVTGYVIPNPVALPAAFPETRPQATERKTHRMIGMGRLVPQKGFDLLLEAFSRVAASHPEWSVKILGDGPLKAQLEGQAEALGLKGRVAFAGPVANPFPELRAADLFVFPSRFEGFGSALCEAMACGLPAISFDCAAGPRDIIRHEVDGLLVPPEDVAALAAAMDRLMGSPQERERLASRAPDVLVRFSMERVLSLWEQLLDRVLSAGGKPAPVLQQGRQERGQRP
jgi:glycosyltransferase involved in cell wall biosynthesis